MARQRGLDAIPEPLGDPLEGFLRVPWFYVVLTVGKTRSNV